MEQIEIKNRDVSISRMLSDYTNLFSNLRSRRGLRFSLICVCVLGVQVLVFLYGPIILVPEGTHVTFLLVVAMINAMFLFGWGSIAVFALISPILGRVIMPMLIGILEAARILLVFPQIMLDCEHHGKQRSDALEKE